VLSSNFHNTIEKHSRLTMRKPSMSGMRTVFIVGLLCVFAGIPGAAYTAESVPAPARSHARPDERNVASAAESTLAPDIGLPAPHTNGKISVEQALKERRSVRNPLPTPLTIEEVGQLCWAAQGVTDVHAHRTAPSAQAKYPLELYVLAGSVTGLAPGLYHYLPSSHALHLVSGGDLRATFVDRGVGQGCVATAPVIFVLSGVPEKMASMGERGRPFMWVEVGLAAQGFLLQATSMGLGSTFVGGIRPAPAAMVLGLPPKEEVLAVLPVGHKP